MKKEVIFILLFSVLMLGTANADVIIIANKNVTENSLSRTEVKDIFLGKKCKWNDNSKVNFGIVKNQDAQKVFLKNYVKKTPQQFKAYWRNMVFTGQGRKPKDFNSASDLVRYVETTDGAVGFVEAGTAIVNVKTISVQ